MTYTKEEVILSVRDINKSYNSKILSDISFDIRNIVRPGVKQGQIVSLIGRSGSGKSTLFRIMAGLEKPDKGSVYRAGIISDRNPQRQMIPVKEGDMGVVFQNSNIYGWRTVWSTLQKALSKNIILRGLPRLHVDEYVKELIFNFDLHDHLGKYPIQLSGGQRQRVAIAEQVLNGGDFILMDEPFSGLDILTIDKVTKALVNLSLTDEYKTLIIVSHDLPNSLAISDTAFILSKSKTGEGSTVAYSIDLAEMGLAFRPDIKSDPEFNRVLEQIKTTI